ncbi:MAG: hypothetical protein H7A01_16765 [Hahellaceae bacterium]|nr:hypothetical protein [Hahellaceae bacterium]MCP5211962.1 hypothetical protein [Hahellaceae bacterium]
MSTPIFADIEASMNDASGFPTAICWSLANGEIKSVLIIPEDEWLEDEENIEPHVNMRELYNHGVPVLDIIREMNEDLDGKTVYMPGHYFENEWLEKLFAAYNIDPSFEPLPLAELLNIDQEDVPGQINQIKLDYALDSPHESESNVLAMLYIAREMGLI